MEERENYLIKFKNGEGVSMADHLEKIKDLIKKIHDFSE